MHFRDHVLRALTSPSKFANLPSLIATRHKSHQLPPYIEGAEDEEPYLPFEKPEFTRRERSDEDGDFIVTGGEPADGIDMGKSNKFDFTNRPSSGVKLGHSIASAFIKEAEKTATKVRKQSSQSTDNVIGGPENQTPSHYIDLQAPNKELSDDGVCALMDGLEVALRSGDNGASMALENLNLSGNAMTTAALVRLAPIIKLARHDLKTLNLSNNNIVIATDEQAQQWEAFLLAFQDCLRLRRLVFSNNAGIGALGMEILARVHIREPPIDPIAPGGDASVFSLVSEASGRDGAQPDSSEADEAAENEARSLSDALLLKRRRGLRSVPYMTLHDIGLTDAGALWLSYVLEDHHYPSQLTDNLNNILALSTIKTYQQTAESNGIDWEQNTTTLGKDGTVLLQKTEAVRRQVMFDDHSTLAVSFVFEDSVKGTEAASTQHRRIATERNLSRSLPGNRRASIRSIRTLDGGEHESSELESARRKIQRHVMEHDKAGKTELWHAALTLIWSSRRMLVLAPVSRKCYTGEPKSSFSAHVEARTPSVSSDVHAQANGHAKKLSVDTKRALEGSKESYAATLTASSEDRTPGSAEVAVTTVTNTPTMQRRVLKPHRKGAFSEGTDMPSVTEKLNVLSAQDYNPERFVKYQHRMIAREGQTTYRDRSAASHLPLRLVERIFALVQEDEGWEVLSDRQRRAAFAWGQDRASLRVEMEWRKKDEASQMWMMLEAVRCLSYGQ